MRTSPASITLFLLLGGGCSQPGPVLDAALALADAALPSDVSLSSPDTGADQPTAGNPWECGPNLGARRMLDGSLEVRVHSSRATRVEVALFDESFGAGERLRAAMTPLGEGRFTLTVEADALAAAGLGEEALYYGFRVFGPNWPYDGTWEPGTDVGRLTDVDDSGNRMNPNKLVLDPYALEMSHDPIHDDHRDYGVYRTDAGNRVRDSAPFAPKGVVVACESAPAGPARPFRDEVVYEVHLRGLTMADPTVPDLERGTYAGAARRAASLRDLGITAIELLPLHETPNDQNELTDDSSGDNYWGYSTLSFLAPDRRYAADKSPGGPTREFRTMVSAFHAVGLKVYVDVVYNHTAEGGGFGDGATILSLRGLDNAGFYELSDDPRGYVNSNGVGPNVNTTQPMVQGLILSSLRYWHEELGVDGFRFDLASVVANGCATGCYRFDRGFPERIADEMGRDPEGGPGVDLIAEPWGAVGDAYQVGNFPHGWAEWNDKFRDAIRRDLNRLEAGDVTLREMVRRISGSADLFADDGRPPAASLNFVVAHDGLTLHDLFRYNGKRNDQPWPYGPSDGGTNSDLAWNHRGDARQQGRATRTAMALLAVSAGVPMITGGDEAGRTLRGNNNPYNLDSPANWLRSPGHPEHDGELRQFTSGLFGFRAAHQALRPAKHWEVFGDADGDGLTEVRWFQNNGSFVNDGYLDDGNRHFIAWQLDGDELGDADATLLFAYNGWSGETSATLPAPPSGLSWHLVIDTSSRGEPFGWVDAAGAGVVTDHTYPVAGRGFVGFVAR